MFEDFAPAPVYNMLRRECLGADLLPEGATSNI
jgi:hypothetical protein